MLIYKQTPVYLPGLKSNITSIKSIDKLRVILTDKAENITINHGIIYALLHAMAILVLYVVFNPRFETDPTLQEFVVRADGNTLLTEINFGAIILVFRSH